MQAGEQGMMHLSTFSYLLVDDRRGEYSTLACLIAPRSPYASWRRKFKALHH